MNEKFNIYTAIAYTSTKPHIGNTYEVILADAIARYKRLEGYDVYFQTGTDEHGQKIEQKAIDSGQEPQEYVDSVALEVRKVWDSVNASYDKFVRTTQIHHKQTVSKIFEKLYKKGDIYKGEYEGLYCTPCESFLTKGSLHDGKCPDCGREPEYTKEEAYFFKLSNYSDRLIKHIEDNPGFIIPESRKNEIVNQFLKPGLEDLCVSRTSFSWGVPVEFDPKHVVYVWLDALSNYITFIGYDSEGNHSEEFKEKWPADVHVIGKDITRFHAIYWPILLMALDVELPKKIFGHPWVLSGEEKMSKSKGNIIYADDLVHHFGIDSVRYYFLSQISYANDGVFTYEIFIDKINSDLANNLGNLVNRTISMAKKYFNGKIPKVTLLEDNDKKFREKIIAKNDKIKNKMNEYKISDAIGEIIDIFDLSNKYIDETTPWVLAKDENSEKLKTVIYNLLEASRHGAVLIQAFLPETATKIFNQLNTKNITLESLKDFDGLDEGIELADPTPLFQRIDKEEKLKEIL